MTVSPAPFLHDRTGTPAGDWRRRAATEPLAPVDLDAVRRFIVVAAHPDDETLGAGGLVAQATRRGIEVRLLCLTEGEGSHPRSPTHDRGRLADRRRGELHAAALCLGLEESGVDLLGLPDGAVAEHTTEVTTAIVDLGVLPGTVVVAPFREDGHPDHEAAGRAAAAACRRTDAELWEYPVWFWHWAESGDERWSRMSTLPLSQEDRTAKSRAIAAHTSQVAPLSDQPGDETLLGPGLLEHFGGDHEHFVRTPGRDCPDPALDELHRDRAEPWDVDERWYEQRKRDLVLALLPRRRFERAAELGCSTGALAEVLAGRAAQVLALDSSPAAVEAARRRNAFEQHVEILRMDLPAELPGSFDLVVVSELGYFLSPDALDELVAQVRRSLSPDGVLVLCHWRHPVRGWPVDGAEVHRRFAEGDVPPLRARYADPDVEILVHAHEWLDPLR